MQITKNFFYHELRCPCCNRMEISEEFINVVQDVRDELARPFVVNSAYRCPAYNRKIGGAMSSRHLQGCAIDISTKRWSPEQMHRLLGALTAIESEDFNTGIGIYPRHIHFDVRADNPSLWINL